MVRIAYLIQKASGDMQTRIRGLLSALDRTRFEPLVVSPSSPAFLTFLSSFGIEHFELETADASAPRADLAAALSVAKTLRAAQPDILHVHGNHAAVIAWFSSRLAPAWRTVTTIHDFPGNTNDSSPYLKYVARMNRSVLDSADRLIAVSTGIKHHLEEDVGIAPQKVEAIPDGIDAARWRAYHHTGRIDLKERLGLPSGATVIGAAGLLAPDKGHAVLLKAMAGVIDRFPKAHLVVVGDGPLREELERLAGELGIARSVRFTGFIEDPGPYMAGFDLFVAPSIKEPSGIGLLEAMALGLPTVATKTGASLDIVEHEQTGLLAEPGDEASLVVEIEKLMNNNYFRYKIAQRGQQHVAEQFTVGAMVDRVCGVYESLLHGK